MAKRPVPKYNFKAFGAAIKAARTGREESRKKVSDKMFISPRYLANIENKGQHPSLQIFFELMLRYNISVEKRRVCVVFSFHLFFLNAVCWCLGLQGSGRHIKALSLKSSKLVVNSA